VRARQRGAFMLEMSLALLISALAAVGVQREIIRTQVLRSADIEADNLKLYRQALQDYTDEFYDELQGALPVTRNGVNLAAGAAEGQTMQPSVANLIAMGYLPAGFANASLLTDAGVFRNLIQRTPAGCAPAIACDITGLAYFDQPFVIRNSGGNTNGVVIGQMLTRIGGLAGTSMETNAATITGAGAGWAANNPVAGAPAGVVGVRFGVGTSVFQAYVRRNDPRDPNLLGNLTVAGTTTLNGATNIGGALTASGAANIGGTLTASGAANIGGTLTASGATNIGGALTASGTAQVNGNTRVGTCAQILAATGRAGFGCANPDDLPAGYTGGLRTPDLVANGRILVSNNPAAFSGTNGEYVLAGLQGGVAEVRTSGRVQADRLIPSGSYTAGAACAPAEAGAIAREAGGTGLVMCRGNTWRTLITFQTAGAACAPNGALSDDGTGAQLWCIGGAWRAMANLLTTATAGSACATQGVTAFDTANGNEVLLCRQNPVQGTLRWFRLRELTSNLMYVFSYDVSEGSTLAMPNCTSAAGIAAFPIIQLVPKVFSSPDGGVAAYAEVSGTNWIIRLRSGADTALTGSAIANTYCYFG
jgi:hypothetical protein